MTRTIHHEIYRDYSSIYIYNTVYAIHTVVSTGWTSVVEIRVMFVFIFDAYAAPRGPSVRMIALHPLARNLSVICCIFDKSTG